MLQTQANINIKVLKASLYMFIRVNSIVNIYCFCIKTVNCKQIKEIIPTTYVALNKIPNNVDPQTQSIQITPREFQLNCISMKSRTIIESNGLQIKTGTP